MPLLAYVAFFSGQLHFCADYFLHSSYFINVISWIRQLLFSEQLYLLSNYFFGVVSFLEQPPFLSISFQISCFFRAKPSPSSCFLRINSSLGQLFFQNSHFFGGRVTFSWHVPLHSIKFLRTATFSPKLLLRQRYLLVKLIFQKSCFLEVVIFSENEYSAAAVFRRVALSK